MDFPRKYSRLVSQAPNELNCLLFSLSSQVTSSSQLPSDNAASPPHQCNTTVIQCPAKFFGCLSQQHEALSIWDNLGSIQGLKKKKSGTLTKRLTKLNNKLHGLHALFSPHHNRDEYSSNIPVIWEPKYPFSLESLVSTERSRDQYPGKGRSIEGRTSSCKWIAISVPHVVVSAHCGLELNSFWIILWLGMGHIMLCGHHETMHSAESRNQFSWNINTRALPQGSQHPKPALTQHKDSPCGYPPGRPSCSHWIESFWAHPAAYWPALSHPWGKTGTVQTQLPLWVRKEEIIKSRASLFMSEILKHHRASLNDEPCTQTK